MLPDDVLLEIFDLYRTSSPFYNPRLGIWSWYRLVYVCQRWRQIVFASPHRLDLKIHGTYGTLRTDISIWPAFPIIIDYSHFSSQGYKTIFGKVIAVLKHSDRICYVNLKVEGSMLGRISEAMQKPFPVLTYLEVRSRNGTAPALPAKFLGGSALSLHRIHLEGIPFPALPTLLLSATDLVTLKLYKIPQNGYISPQAIIVGLAALPKLQAFVLKFQLAPPRSDRINSSPPPTIRTVLPVLTSFHFQGASEYLEDLVARIDTPQLRGIEINFLNQLVDFQVPQLSKFVDRSIDLELTSFRHAHIDFSSGSVKYAMSHNDQPEHSSCRHPTILILCQGIDWQVSHLAHVFSQLSATLSNVVLLDIHASGSDLEGTDDVEWLHLLHQFPTLQTLDVHPRELAKQIALALEDITAVMIDQVLPSLDSISLEGQPSSSIEKFVALRQLSGRPVAVFNSETKLLASSVSE